jgi:hypothetical protein
MDEPFLERFGEDQFAEGTDEDVPVKRDDIHSEYRANARQDA